MDTKSENLTTHESPEIKKGQLFPIGVEGLPPVTKRLENPYRSSVTDYELIVSLVTGTSFLASNVKDLVQKNFSRRNFLKLSAATSAGLLAYGLDKQYGGLIDKLNDYSSAGALAIQVPEAIAFSLHLDFFAKPEYEDRLQKKLSLGPAANYEKMPDCGDNVLSLKFTNPATGTPIEFYGYKEKGKLTPIFGESNIVAGRSDYFHETYNSPFAAFYNATAPGAIEWAKSLKMQPIPTLSPVEQQIIYGTSSLFIPSATPPNSPIWDHATNRLTHANSEFNELTYRQGDPTHQGYGFTVNGSGRLIKQAELEKIIKDRHVPKDLHAVTLNQFAYDPRETKMADRNKELPFSNDRHRSLAMLLTDKDGSLYVIAGPPDFYLTAPDYDRVVEEFAKAYKTEFQAVVCLDLGMAGGFTISEKGKILKPNYRSITGKNDLNLSLSHTGAITLIDKIQT